MDKLAGVFCAFWTPADPDGEVLWEAFDANLDWVVRSGVNGVMALGSTAEFPHFNLEERKTILERILRACRPREVPVLANISAVQHRHAIELARHAKAAGASVISILPPWFFPIEQRDLIEFFVTIGRAADLPVALYNYPEVTGTKIALSTIQEVARRIPVIAVKQSGGDFEYHHELLRLGRELGFGVLTGADTQLEKTLALGCRGTVSGLANAVADLLSRIYCNFQTGASSQNETDFISRLGAAIRPLPFPLNVKAAIAARGFETGAPKNPISPRTGEAYEETVPKLQQLYRELPEASTGVLA